MVEGEQTLPRAITGPGKAKQSPSPLKATIRFKKYASTPDDAATKKVGVSAVAGVNFNIEVKVACVPPLTLPRLLQDPSCRACM